MSEFHVDDTTDLRALPADVARREIDRVVREASQTAYAQAQTIPAADRELALDVLTAELGSRAEAAERIALDPAAALAEIRPKLAAERQRRADAEKAQADAEYADSPEGRRATVKAQAAAAREKAQLVEDARETLLATNPHFAMEPALLDLMEPDEILAEAGIEPLSDEPEIFQVPPPTEQESRAHRTQPRMVPTIRVTAPGALRRNRPRLREGVSGQSHTDPSQHLLVSERTD